MDVFAIIPDRIYSIKYDEEDTAEYNRLFEEEWTDVEFLTNFFQSHPEYTENEFWGFLGNDPEKAAARVLKDAHMLELHLRELAKNSDNGKLPDLEDYFKPLNGKYGYDIEYIPVKGYGVLESTFLRLYAIRFTENCYLIVYGGIKLNSSIQNSPDLQDNVFRKIDKVKQFLVDESIIDKDDI
jgi:hypothetical protein